MIPVRRERVVYRLLTWLFFSSALISGGVSAAIAQSTRTPQPSGIEWQEGPMVADLGGVAEVQVPKGYAFTGAAGTKRFLELNQDPTSGNEVGLMVPVPKPGIESPDWFMLFEFHEVGYITDNDRSSLDADALLASIQKDTERANEIRKQRGWPAFHVSGWARKPFYDDGSHNLTWAVLGQGDGENSQAVNYSVRILGRRGTMSVDLVLDPKDLDAVLPNTHA